MAINQEFEGSRRSVVVSYPSSPTPGQMCRVGSGICGVALTAKDSNNYTVVEFSSESYWNLSITADSGAIAVGDPLYFHDANGINNTASGGIYCGNAMDAIASGTATIRVVLPGAGAAYVNATIQLEAFAISATVTVFIGKMPVKGTVVGASIVSDTAVTASDTNYWSLQVTNKGQAGSGSTAIATKTTMATGGVSLTAYVEQALALSGTPANLVVAAGDIIVLTLTKTASATTMATLLAILKVQ
jgi:hypothetical protein